MSAESRCREDRSGHRIWSKAEEAIFGGRTRETFAKPADVAAVSTTVASTAVSVFCYWWRQRQERQTGRRSEGERETDREIARRAGDRETKSKRQMESEGERDREREREGERMRGRQRETTEKELRQLLHKGGAHEERK